MELLYFAWIIESVIYNFTVFQAIIHVTQKDPTYFSKPVTSKKKLNMYVRSRMI